MKKRIAIITFIIGGLVGLLFALGISQFIYMTGDDKFCTLCHVMEPMGKAYKDDVHGGKNELGVKASCASCHLPHDNVLKYTYQKAINGIYEGAVNFFGNPEEIDWKAKRKESKKYVYDSGCLHCHANLQNSTSSNMKAFLGHRDYFAKTIDKSCVECHEFVGHKNLGFHLNSNLDDLNITK